MIFISFFFFANFKSLQNENFAVLSERFSAREKSLGRNDSLFFPQIKLWNFELLVRERKKNATKSWAQQRSATKQKNKLLPFKQEIKCRFCYSVSFSLFLLVSFCWCFSGSKHWSSCWKGEAKERIVAANDAIESKSWKVCANFWLKHHCLKRVKGRCSFSSVYCVFERRSEIAGVYLGVVGR